MSEETVLFLGLAAAIIIAALLWAFYFTPALVSA